MVNFCCGKWTKDVWMCGWRKRISPKAVTQDASPNQEWLFYYIGMLSKCFIQSSVPIMKSREEDHSQRKEHVNLFFSFTFQPSAPHLPELKVWTLDMSDMCLNTRPPTRHLSPSLSIYLSISFSLDLTFLTEGMMDSCSKSGGVRE